MCLDNCIKINKKSLLYFYYAYIDVKDFLADRFFINRQIKIGFIKDYEKHGTEFVVSFVKIYKKDEEIFLIAMEELDKNIKVVGYNDNGEYTKFIEEIGEKIKEMGKNK